MIGLANAVGLAAGAEDLPGAKTGKGTGTDGDDSSVSVASNQADGAQPGSLMALLTSENENESGNGRGPIPLGIPGISRDPGANTLVAGNHIVDGI